MSEPLPGGYRDLTLKFEKDGHVAELQVNVKPMLRAKVAGHKLYEEYRSLDEAINKEGRLPTQEESAHLRKLISGMEKVYHPAWAEANR